MSILEIAGVRFQDRLSPAAVGFPPHYRPFLEEGYSGGGVVPVEVSIERGIVPAASGTRLFSTDVSWSLYRDGGEYLVALDPPCLGGGTVWSARFPRSVERVHIRILEGEGQPLTYPLDQILTMYALAGREGVILHAAGFARGGRGYAFLGRSGAGKTTLAGLLRGGGGGWEGLSDDRVVARRVGGEHTLFGTPWPGEGRAAENRHCPLSGLLFLGKGNGHRMRPLDPGEVIDRLLPVASVPWYDAQVFPALIDYCGALMEQVPAWDLTFAPEASLEGFLGRALDGL